MLRMRLEPPIVKPGGKVKNLAGEIILAKSALVFHDSKNLDFTNGVLDLDAYPRYIHIGPLLLLGKFFSFRFLCRLYHSDVIWIVPSITSILLKNALKREGIHLIGDTLIVHLSLNGKTNKEDNSCNTGNYYLLDGMFLLFATMVLLLEGKVGKSRNFALCSVMNEFMYNSVTSMLVKKSSESGYIGSRKHSCKYNNLRRFNIQ